MKYVSYEQLNDTERMLVEEAFEAITHSISPRGHRVGAALLCNNGAIFKGATLARTRIIGSTCAERMAVDQMYYSGHHTLKLCAVVGFFNRSTWTEDDVRTPCGTCLEMFVETLGDEHLDNIDFICVSYNKKNIVRTNLLELLPKPNHAAGRRSWTTEDN